MSRMIPVINIAQVPLHQNNMENSRSLDPSSISSESHIRIRVGR